MEVREMTTVEKFINGYWVGAGNLIIKRLDDENVVFYQSTQYGYIAIASEYTLQDTKITVSREPEQGNVDLRELTEDEETFTRFADSHNESREKALAKEFGVDQVQGLTYLEHPIIGVFADISNDSDHTDWVLIRHATSTTAWIILNGDSKDCIKLNGKCKQDLLADQFKNKEWLVLKTDDKETIIIKLIGQLNERYFAVGYSIRGDRFPSFYEFEFIKTLGRFTFADSTQLVEFADANHLKAIPAQLDNKIEQTRSDFQDRFRMNVTGSKYRGHPIIGAFPAIKDRQIIKRYVAYVRDGRVHSEGFEFINPQHVEPEPSLKTVEFKMKVGHCKSSDCDQLNTVGELFESHNKVHLITADFMLNSARYLTVVSRDGLAVTYDEPQFKCLFGNTTPATQLQKEQFYRGLELEYHGEIGEVAFTSNSIVFVPEKGQPVVISESALKDLKLASGRGSL